MSSLVCIAGQYSPFILFILFISNLKSCINQLCELLVTYMQCDFPKVLSLTNNEQALTLVQYLYSWEERRRNCFDIVLGQLPAASARIQNEFEQHTRITFIHSPICNTPAQRFLNSGKPYKLHFEKYTFCFSFRIGDSTVCSTTCHR